MGTRAMTMDVSGPPDWFVSLCTGVGGIGVAFLWLRKYMRADGVDRASSEAKTTIIDALRTQLVDSNKRNDQLLAALDGAHAKINELTNHVFQLEVQVRRLRQQLDEMAPRTEAHAVNQGPQE